MAAGGVTSAEDAYRKLRLGATRRPALHRARSTAARAWSREILRGLPALLERDGFESVADAVGADRG